MGASEPETSEVLANGTGGEKSAAVIEPVVKKGITLRPSNIKKLEQLELSLRNRGLKPSQSGLIQIAIDRLQDGPQLEEECRKLVMISFLRGASPRFTKSFATASSIGPPRSDFLNLSNIARFSSDLRHPSSSYPGGRSWGRGCGFVWGKACVSQAVSNRLCA